MATNHPNRTKNSEAVGLTPSAEQVKALREAYQQKRDLGITAAQKDCALMVHTSLRNWQQWESEGDSHRRMHPAFWELFNIKLRKFGLAKQ